MISIIIPTLNDAKCLAACLEDLEGKRGTHEVIVVDGGSLDGTPELLKKTPWVKSLSSPPGRGGQMNAGAAAAAGEVLLFLHADTRLPSNWATEVESLLKKTGTIMGAFRLQLDAREWPFRVIEQAVHIRSRWLGLPYGDQAYFLRTEQFHRLGTFPDQPLMEDVELVQKARRLGRVRVSKGAVTSSARNWKRDGILCRTWRNWKCYLSYRLGYPTSKTATLYKGERNAVIVFCKEPIPGKVKTRLAADLGEEDAAQVYRTMVENTLGMLENDSASYRILLCFDPPRAKASMLSWLGPHLYYIPQAEGHLGDRMLAAFARSKELGFNKTVLIGTDCPSLNQEHLQDAFSALNHKDVVFGPTEDGGYYLVATRRPHPPLFESIPWSTEAVLERSLATAKAHGLSTATTERLRDLDTLKDLEWHQRNGYFNDA